MAGRKAIGALANGVQVFGTVVAEFEDCTVIEWRVEDGRLARAYVAPETVREP